MIANPGLFCDMGGDNALCDKGDEKWLNIDGYRAGEGSVETYVGWFSIRCAEVDEGWDNWRLLLSLSGGDALFRKSEATAREWCDGTVFSVTTSANRGLSAGEE